MKIKSNKELKEIILKGAKPKDVEKALAELIERAWQSGRDRSSFDENEDKRQSF